MTTLSLVIIIGVALLILAVGFYIVPYLNHKGYLTLQNVNTTKQILGIAQLVLQGMQVNKGVKDQANTIFDITQKVVQYVEQTMKDSDNSHKKQYAVDATKDILGKVGIQLSDDNQKLVEVGIEAAVNALPKTNKAITVNVPVQEAPVVPEPKLPDAPFYTGFTGIAPAVESVPVAEPVSIVEPASIVEHGQPVVRESEPAPAPAPAPVAPIVPARVGSSDI